MTKQQEKSSKAENVKEIAPVELIRIDKIYESLRYNDYSPENGLGELVDNSVEAGALNICIFTKVEKVKIVPKKRPTDTIVEIAVVDDGTGMNETVLQNSLVLGESVRDTKNGNRGIGRFGLGMTLGSISLARRVEVYSRENRNDKFMYVSVDLDAIFEKKQEDMPAPVFLDPPEQYMQVLSKSSGTVVILKDCDRIEGNPDFTNYLGRTYRKFIERGLNIMLNNRHVFLHDPLYMTGPTRFDDERIEAGESMDPKAASLGVDKITLPVPGSDGETADITIRMSLLPEEWRQNRGDGGSKEAKLRKIPDNEGVSILRADREVLYGHVPYIFGNKGIARSKEIDRWWGCEISFPPELDPYFQVKYIKRGAEPIPEVRDQIRDKIKAVVSSARKIIQATWDKTSSENQKKAGDFGKAEETMKNTGKKLPKSKKGKDLTEEEEDSRAETVAKTALGDEDKKDCKKREQKKNEIKKKPYSILPVSYPSTILFETVYLTDGIIIQLNVNHPFYKKVISPLCGDLDDSKENVAKNSVKDAILLLLFSYAKAESMFENNETLFSTLRAHWGTVLAAALEEYDLGGNS